MATGGGFVPGLYCGSKDSFLCRGWVPVGILYKGYVGTNCAKNRKKDFLVRVVNFTEQQNTYSRERGARLRSRTSKKLHRPKHTIPLSHYLLQVILYSTQIVDRLANHYLFHIFQF